MNRIESHKKAFTLVEVILYIGLFGFIFTTIISFVFIISDLNNRNKYQIETEKAALFVTENIEEAFRTIKSIDTNNSVFDSDTGTLVLVQSDNSTSIYHVQNGRLIVDTDSANNITGSNVVVTKFKLQRIMEGSSVNGVILDFSVASNKNLNITSDISDTYIID